MSKFCASSATRGGVGIVWFRMTDLRTIDHEPLHLAHTLHDFVVHVCCYDHRVFGSTAVDFSKSLPAINLPKTGIRRTKFLVESVTDLKSRLEQIHSKQSLIVCTGFPESVIPALAAQCGASTVYCHDAEAPEEEAVQRAVERNLHGVLPSCSLKAMWGNTLYHVDDVPFITAPGKIGNGGSKGASFPASATQFRTACEKSCRIPPPLPPPRAGPPSPSELGFLFKPPPLSSSSSLTIYEERNKDGNIVPSVQSLSPDAHLLQDPNFRDDRTVLDFIGGETEALKRLTDYFFTSDCLKDYFHTRNGMVGANYSSKFSPWLAAGCVSPRYIAAEVARYEVERVKNKDTYWMIFELTFRDYFRFYVRKHGNSVFKQWGPKGKRNATPTALEWSPDLITFQRWCNGETGNPMIDANMIELNKTGFMSNRGRQIVASYLTRDLKVDWRLGAMYFESMLIDHDPCLNWGNWTYAAGVGSDPREDRYFNIPKQTSNYDPQYQFIRHWLESMRRKSDAEIQGLLRVGTYKTNTVVARPQNTVHQKTPSAISGCPVENSAVDFSSGSTKKTSIPSTTRPLKNLPPKVSNARPFNAAGAASGTKNDAGNYKKS